MDGSELVVYRLDNWSEREVLRIGSPYINGKAVEAQVALLNQAHLGECAYTVHTQTGIHVPLDEVKLRQARDMDFAHCMDVLDWFNDSALYEYLYHVMVSQLDADACIGRIMPMLQNRVQLMMDFFADTDYAYPA